MRTSALFNALSFFSHPRWLLDELHKGYQNIPGIKCSSIDSFLNIQNPADYYAVTAHPNVVHGYDASARVLDEEKAAVQAVKDRLQKKYVSMKVVELHHPYAL